MSLRTYIFDRVLSVWHSARTWRQRAAQACPGRRSLRAWGGLGPLGKAVHTQQGSAWKNSFALDKRAPLRPQSTAAETTNIHTFWTGPETASGCFFFSLNICVFGHVRPWLQHPGSSAVACGIPFPDRGLNLGPLRGKCGVSAAGPPGKSQPQNPS